MYQNWYPGFLPYEYIVLDSNIMEPSTICLGCSFYSAFSLIDFMTDYVCRRCCLRLRRRTRSPPIPISIIFVAVTFLLFLVGCPPIGCIGCVTGGNGGGTIIATLVGASVGIDFAAKVIGETEGEEDGKLFGSLIIWGCSVTGASVTGCCCSNGTDIGANVVGAGVGADVTGAGLGRDVIGTCIISGCLQPQVRRKIPRDCNNKHI